jgi:membrane protein implicated in regulation of membrane protease activity
MEPYLIWMLIGFALVIVELLSGTFYLLMLGVAAFGGAASAYLGHGFEAQIIVAAIIAAAGCYGVHIYRARSSKEQMASVDAGQPANFENWVDQAGGLARVRYRGASWDAHIDGGGELSDGALLYVMGIEGHTLKVSRRRPG